MPHLSALGVRLLTTCYTGVLFTLLFVVWHHNHDNASLVELNALPDSCYVLNADADMSCERLPVAALPDHRKVIEEIVHAAPGGILESELPQQFEVSSCWLWQPTQKRECMQCIFSEAVSLWFCFSFSSVVWFYWNTRVVCYQSYDW